MSKRAVIYPDDQALVVVVRPNGDPGVLINPRFGWTPSQAADVLQAIATRLRTEPEYSHPDPR